MSASASEIETTVFNLFLTREFQCAATALMVYDYLLTLDREITFFWYYAGRWTVPRILFFVNRYFALFAICLNTSGAPVFYLQHWFSFLDSLSALASTAITKHFCASPLLLRYEWIHFLVVTFGSAIFRMAIEKRPSLF
ncbi:hypothetical protein FB451DRAFT_1183462 [Mycena latifolia]|nr:hypothetical protein FB451DRAFT_1183462 [Mycena latifolia]